MCSPPLQTQPMNGPMKTAAFFFFNSFLCLFWRLIDFYGIKTVTFFFLSFFFILSHGDVLVDFVSAIEVRPRWTLAVLFISFFLCLYRVLRTRLPGFSFFFFSFFRLRCRSEENRRKESEILFFFFFFFFLDPQSTTNNKQTNKQTNKQKHRVALERTSSTECRCVSRTAGDFDVGDAPETKPPDILVFLLFFFFFSFFFFFGASKITDCRCCRWKNFCYERTEAKKNKKKRKTKDERGHPWPFSVAADQLSSSAWRSSFSVTLMTYLPGFFLFFSFFFSYSFFFSKIVNRNSLPAVSFCFHAKFKGVPIEYFQPNDDTNNEESNYRINVYLT